MFSYSVFCSTEWMLYKADPTLHQNNIIVMIKHILLFKHVWKRFFDELVKEWLLDRYIIVSGSFREIDGRKVLVRKSHLRRKR